MSTADTDPQMTFEDTGRALLASAQREHPMLTPDMRRWIEEACRRLAIEPAQPPAAAGAP